MIRILVEISSVEEVSDALKYRLTRDDGTPADPDRLLRMLNAMIESIEPWLHDEPQVDDLMDDLDRIHDPDAVEDGDLLHLDHEDVMLLYHIHQTRRTHPMLRNMDRRDWSVEFLDTFGDVTFTFF